MSPPPPGKEKNRLRLLPEVGKKEGEGKKGKLSTGDLASLLSEKGRKKKKNEEKEGPTESLPCNGPDAREREKDSLPNFGFTMP